MPALKPGTILPTDDEDAAIIAAVQSDPDAAPILTEDEWARIKPRLRVGRPRVETPKVSTTFRFDADVLEAMKATGKGWQTRINDIVRAYVETHR